MTVTVYKITHNADKPQPKSLKSIFPTDKTDQRIRAINRKMPALPKALGGPGIMAKLLVRKTLANYLATIILPKNLKSVGSFYPLVIKVGDF